MDIANHISETGFIFNNGNILDLDINDLQNWYEAQYTARIQNSAYSNELFMSEAELLHDPVCHQLVSNIIDSYGLSNKDLYRLDKLWLNTSNHDFTKRTNTFVDTHYPHIDKTRHLKVFVYVSDVGPSQGPFHIAPCNPGRYEKIRLRCKKTKIGDNLIPDISKDQFISCHGPAGSVIIFDTNCPHFAGLIDPGKQRRVLRLHFTSSMFKLMYNERRLRSLWNLYGHLTS
ncbi:MAG: hypothetical protein CL398_02055 [Acidiferrobacteraceae bacterium]|nr:hypothetical protein [Acidiferrobacteraceae bacterium]|tara:strand:+ start:172 stop:861 length:690 start_codon:yes stop_codon:yes gene_type:complete